MSNDKLAARFCSFCGMELARAGARFCSECGAGQGQAAKGGKVIRMGARETFFLVVISLAVWLVVWNVQGFIAGSKPTTPFSPAASAAKDSGEKDDPVIAKLRTNARAFPDEKNGWKALAAALIERLRGEDEPPSDQILEAIDVLREVLRIDPKDEFGLLNMADLSFEQQIFDKAAEYYQRYLSDHPKDLNTRVRYGSSLAFIGKSKEAETELKAVLKEDPNHFHASAYLAITYAQMGERERAVETGNKALEAAPSEEARARFSSFLDSVKSGQARTPADIASPSVQRGNLASGAEQSEGLGQVEEFIRANPIAGPKFAGSALENQILKLSFNNFPMDQMPPMIREKFTASIKEQVKISLSGKAKEIVFFDEAAGKELLRAAL